ncbi:MAG TPA: site-2 protease family protein [Acidimicrobiales bacterium]
MPDAGGRRGRASLRIATVAGIDIRVHASFLLLVAFVVATAAPPGGPTIAEHLTWLVLLFAAVTVHELAHSLVARRYGSPVEAIDLLPVGGVSRLGRLPDDPGQQARVALAGPLASVVLAVVLGAGAVAAGLPLSPADLLAAPLPVRLAWVNLLLAGFNLLPAFPLDGGRLLRAVLARRMDGDRATAVAARIGRRLALGMIVGGVLANLWIAVLGVFVLAGSQAEEASTIARLDR